MAPARFQLVARAGHPDFLDLPWDVPLEAWESERLVEVARGISRHVVRFVEYNGAIYALKELPEPLARREYRLLRGLTEREMPVVEGIGVVTGRSQNDELDAILITRHLDYSLPYRTVFARRIVPDLRERLLDALAELLVRLHLAGFFWGDCSLSNSLFRRDAGALAAYVVDAETGELHPQLSSGQQLHDLQIAEANITGELLDLEAAGELPPGIDPIDTASDVLRRYDALWSELTREEIFDADERYRIDARLRRLNELGFDVEELELASSDDGLLLRLPARVVEPGHHRRRLFELTGIDAQENQARRLLNDIAGFRCFLESELGKSIPESVVARRWILEVFDPSIQMIPEELRGRLDPVEAFHQILEHRWFLSEAAGRDVGLEEAVRSYVENVLRFAPEERTVLSSGSDGAAPPS
jgi:hypothetical protein